MIFDDQDGLVSEWIVVDAGWKLAMLHLALRFWSAHRVPLSVPGKRMVYYLIGTKFRRNIKLIFKFKYSIDKVKVLKTGAMTQELQIKNIIKKLCLQILINTAFLILDPGSI
jgi:hypothetical protein